MPMKLFTKNSLTLRLFCDKMILDIKILKRKAVKGMKQPYFTYFADKRTSIVCKFTFKTVDTRGESALFLSSDCFECLPPKIKAA